MITSRAFVSEWDSNIGRGFTRIDADQICQYRLRTGVPDAAAALGWWMRAGNV